MRHVNVSRIHARTDLFINAYIYIHVKHACMASLMCWCIYVSIRVYMEALMLLHVGLCQPHGQKSMLQRLAAAPKKSFPETKTPKVGALVIVKTGGVAQQWRVSNIKIATGTLVTINFENSAMTVDVSWVCG